MRSFSKIKSVDANWLGKIPEHWDCKKVRSLFTCRNEKVSDKDFAPLSVSKMGVVPQLETAVKSDAGDNRKLVCAGDFVINSRSDRKGSCGISSLDGSVTLISIVLEPCKSWNKKYVHYLLRSQPFSEEFFRNGRGIVDDLWTTRYSEMKNILLPVPPRPEQDQIVRYLDWQVSRIDKLIEGKKRELNDIWALIQLFLFSESGERSSIGSFQTAFDQFPTIKAKRLFVERSSKGHTDKELLAVTQDRGVLYKKDCPQNYVKPNDISKQKLVVNGDYIISLRSFQGGIEFSELEGLVSTSYSVFYIRDEFKFFQEYYALLFKSAPFVSYLNSLVNDIRDGKKIDFNTFSQCELPKPPASLVNKIHELKQAYNDRKNALNRFKELTEELKQSLISDVVTGRKDVRSIDVPN